MKHNYFTEVSLLFHIIPQNPDSLVSYCEGFTVTMTEIRLLNSSCFTTGGRSCKCYVTGPKITVHWARPAPYVVPKDHTSQHMFMPQPANSLMQIAQHVTAYNHIHFWISKYKYNADDSCSTEYRCHCLRAYQHPYILWL